MFRQRDQSNLRLLGATAHFRCAPKKKLGKRLLSHDRQSRGFAFSFRCWLETTTKPLSCGVPHFIVIEPERQPWNDRVCNKHRWRPIFVQMQTHAAVVERVWNLLP